VRVTAGRGEVDVVKLVTVSRDFLYRMFASPTLTRPPGKTDIRLEQTRGINNNVPSAGGGRRATQSTGPEDLPTHFQTFRYTYWLFVQTFSRYYYDKDKIYYIAMPPAHIYIIYIPIYIYNVGLGSWVSVEYV